MQNSQWQLYKAFWIYGKVLDLCFVVYISATAALYFKIIFEWRYLLVL